MFETFRTSIGVEISGAVPTYIGFLQIDFDTRRWGNGAPDVAFCAVDRKRLVVDELRVEANDAANRGRYGRGLLVDVDCQNAAVPKQCARPNLEDIRRDANGVLSALRHRPAVFARRIKRHIKGAVIERRSRFRPRVVRRKDAADEGDNRDAVVAGVAERVDIPPGVSVAINVYVEPYAAFTIFAAIFPDNAAIGTPGPGCTPPPVM